MNDFTLKFVKITPSTINKADGQLQRMAEQDAQQEPPKTSAQLVFQERKNNLLDILSKKGGTDLSTLWKMRYHYIRSQCELEQNHSDFNRNGLAMVYDNVISKALVSKAYQITQDVAKEWDSEIHDLNHQQGVAIYPTTWNGAEHEETTLESICPHAPQDLTQAGQPEPYAGTRFEDMF